MACGVSACCRGPLTERQKCRYPSTVDLHVHVVCFMNSLKHVAAGQFVYTLRGFPSRPVCFKVFDQDMDGMLSYEEVRNMLSLLTVLQQEERVTNDEVTVRIVFFSLQCVSCCLFCFVSGLSRII